MTILVTNFTTITMVTKVRSVPMNSMVNSVVKVSTNVMVAMVTSIVNVLPAFLGCYV